MLQDLRRLNPERSEDLIWDTRDQLSLDRLVPAHIHDVTNAFNELDYEAILEPLRALRMRDPETGIEFARLAKPQDNATTAVVHFNPFGNGLSDHMLLRADYCNQALRAGGLGDARGRTLPFVTMAAPSGNQQLHLDRHHHRRIARGQFDTLALQHLRIIKQLGYERIAIIGFSQGASLAIAAAAVASQLGLEVTHVAIGEPANIVARSRSKLARQFFGSSRHLPAAVKAVNLKALHQAHGQEKASDLTVKLLRKIRLNYNLLSGLSKPSFEAELDAVLRQGIPITLGYGDLTTISPPSDVRRIVTRVRREPDYKTHSLHVVEVTGGHHTWADTLNLLATFYTYALLR